ncbi:MAG: SDR family oxidoreductase [Rhodobiaceae bacterium]|nr:SDR family oxidoreductase [Novosphingobium sp.]MCC0057625.1 SDR family oxidoreductase [Rhodobiaceae bacterium]
MGLLDGKVVAITGAGRGIGRSLALECAAQGASVVVNDFGGSLTGEGTDDGPAQSVVSEIKTEGGRAIANVASVADPQGAQSIVDDALSSFGRIDGVVNNAGVSRDGMFHKMSLENWRAVVDVHLNGSFYLSRAAAPHFREQESGAFVFLTSTSGLVGNVGQSNYSAAKMALVGLSNSIALDMRRYGVRSNCVAPFAWSRMTESIPADTPEAKERVERLKSMTADKVAPMVGFLCSDAASEVSGQIFCVRKNEIFLFNPSRPVRSFHRSEGWTGDTIVSDFLPAIRPNLFPLQVSADVFSWDPV